MSPDLGIPLDRCPECGTVAAIWHKLGCSRDDQERRSGRDQVRPRRPADAAEGVAAGEAAAERLAARLGRPEDGGGSGESERGGGAGGVGAPEVDVRPDPEGRGEQARGVPLDRPELEAERQAVGQSLVDAAVRQRDEARAEAERLRAERDAAVRVLRDIRAKAIHGLRSAGEPA